MSNYLKGKDERTISDDDQDFTTTPSSSASQQYIVECHSTAPNNHILNYMDGVLMLLFICHKYTSVGAVYIANVKEMYHNIYYADEYLPLHTIYSLCPIIPH